MAATQHTRAGSSPVSRECLRCANFTMCIAFPCTFSASYYSLISSLSDPSTNMSLFMDNLIRCRAAVCSRNPYGQNFATRSCRPADERFIKRIGSRQWLSLLRWAVKAHLQFVFVEIEIHVERLERHRILRDTHATAHKLYLKLIAHSVQLAMSFILLISINSSTTSKYNTNDLVKKSDKIDFLFCQYRMIVCIEKNIRNVVLLLLLLPTVPVSFPLIVCLRKSIRKCMRKIINKHVHENIFHVNRRQTESRVHERACTNGGGGQRANNSQTSGEPKN